MILQLFSSMPNYRIAIEYAEKHKNVTLAGFTAAEESEDLLCRHLRNLCLQSDGSFFSTQQLVVKLMNQWQQSFSMQAIQILQSISGQERENVASVSLYKQTNSSKERLINKINF